MGPFIGPFWGTGYAACPPLISPTQQASATGLYLHVNGTYPGYAGIYWRQYAVYGPVPAAQRLPLTAPRKALHPAEPLSLPELDPNLRRKISGVMRPVADTVPLADPTRVPETPVETPDFSRYGVIALSPTGVTTTNKPQSPATFPVSRPPSRRTIEKKLRVTQHVGAAIFKALDTLSESAEKIDCIYKALPKSRRLDKKKLPKRGLLDAAGQYGIDHADYKIPLIYKHFDEINWPQALHCIGLNEIEDRLIGRVQADLKKIYRGPSSILTERFGKTISKVLDPEKGFLAYDGPGSEKKEAHK